MFCHISSVKASNGKHFIGEIDETAGIIRIPLTEHCSLVCVHFHLSIFCCLDQL